MKQHTYVYSSREEAANACIRRFAKSAVGLLDMTMKDLRACASEKARRCLMSIILIESKQLAKQGVDTTAADFATALRMPLGKIVPFWKAPQTSDLPKTRKARLLRVAPSRPFSADA